MSEEVLIRVEGLGKKFCKNLKKSLLYGVQDVAQSLVGIQSKRDLRKEEFWVLKDINFELKRGDCLGLLGHNGAGKSTLLKVLNGLIKPDEGQVTIKGRVGALIELGAGFNPILTGRENIYNNASVLGFSKKETDEKLEEIIDFSEIREFIDAPVQSYSSGMKVRLGFAVAAQMEPDVLFIDEVLAVGDVGFRVKCLNRISELLNTCAVIYVSHSMPQVARISNRAMMLDNGGVEYFGSDIGYGIQLYQKKFKKEDKIIAGGGIDIDLIQINGQQDLDEFSVNYDDEIKLKLRFNNNVDNEDFFVNIIVMDANLNGVVCISSKNYPKVKWTKGLNEVDVFFKNCLTPGLYSVNIGFIKNNLTSDYKYGETIMLYRNIISLSVTGGSLIGGIPVQLNSIWKLN